MKQEALKLGISIENTSIVNLITQINTIKISDEADKLGISTNGKEIEEIGRNLWNESKRGSREVRDFTKGKEIEELAQEVYEQKVQEEAKNIILICMGKIYIKY